MTPGPRLTIWWLHWHCTSNLVWLLAQTLEHYQAEAERLGRAIRMKALSAKPFPARLDHP
jgi:hypothetical protein